MSDVSQTKVQEFLDLFLNEDAKLSLRQAVVQATLAAPNRVRIRLGGQPPDIDARYLASYAAPAVNDVVWCLLNGSDVLVMGKLA